MSLASRLLRGNLASGATLAVNLAAQLAVVPVLLTSWGAESYGYWLGIMAAVTFFGLADLSHHDFVGFELMKLRHGDQAGRSQILADAIAAMVIVGAAELVLLTGVLQTSIAARLLHLPATGPLAGQIHLSIFVLFAVWLGVQNVASVLNRALDSLGYFSRTAWWYTFQTAGAAVVPAAIAHFGGSIADAALAQAGWLLAVYTLIYVHHLSLLRLEGITIARASARRGLHRYRRSLGVWAANILENLQQAGFRLLLLPLVGPAALAQFASLRTVANLGQQGLLTLLGPSMPELVRTANNGDEPRLVALMHVLTFAGTFLLCPAFVVLQVVAPFAYRWWTAGELAFQPTAFALLSSAVVIYATGQPFRAIVRGNNLVRAQFAISLLSAGVLGFSLLPLVSLLGLAGAALCLVVAEIVRLVLNISLAARWFAANGLTFPAVLAAISTTLCCLTVAVLMLIQKFETDLAVLAMYVLGWMLCLMYFLRLMPAEVGGLFRRRFKALRPG